MGSHCPTPRGSSQPGYRTWVPCIAGRFFTVRTTREALDHGAHIKLTPKFPFALVWPSQKSGVFYSRIATRGRQEQACPAQSQASTRPACPQQRRATTSIQALEGAWRGGAGGKRTAASPRPGSLRAGWSSLFIWNNILLLHWQEHHGPEQAGPPPSGHAAPASRSVLRSGGGPTAGRGRGRIGGWGQRGAPKVDAVGAALGLQVCP